MSYLHVCAYSANCLETRSGKGCVNRDIVGLLLIGCVVGQYWEVCCIGAGALCQEVCYVGSLFTVHRFDIGVHIARVLS